ncbi:hypothetical protein LTR33_019152, partial [Friedmanniomyces endolithicus]
ARPRKRSSTQPVAASPPAAATPTPSPSKPASKPSPPPSRPTLRSARPPSSSTSDTRRARRSATMRCVEVVTTVMGFPALRPRSRSTISRLLSGLVTHGLCRARRSMLGLLRMVVYVVSSLSS